MGESEIDRDALLLPVAVAGGVAPILLTCGRLPSRFGLPNRFGFRNWGRLAEIGGRLEMLWPFHGANMGRIALHAKH